MTYESDQYRALKRLATKYARLQAVVDSARELIKNYRNYANENMAYHIRFEDGEPNTNYHPRIRFADLFDSMLELYRTEYLQLTTELHLEDEWKMVIYV
jgi:hypothetical protein